MAAEDVEVVSLTRRPEEPKFAKRSKRVVFQVLVQLPWTDQTGLPAVGGRPKHVAKGFDFAISPVQDHQQFLLVDHQGPLRYQGPPSRLLITRNDLWLDIGISPAGSNGDAVVLYRIDRAFDSPDVIDLGRSGESISAGSVLATLFSACESVKRGSNQGSQSLIASAVASFVRGDSSIRWNIRSRCSKCSMT